MTTYVLTIDVEMTETISDETREAAAKLLADDVGRWLKAEGWGYGRARVDAVYPRAESEG